ncbi:hypothetical protein DUNSADRAFT_4470 [Dunaliella salina]|uniref:Uncharacterized protein n=1 Tax=Dunaliella salina TaxID=3046 RepID=A0ABQ7GRY8_DUNSA|nr:hypothetical protein DUNSADRAFT_4470 [Dunaliella salina]|eukprot:KAF5837367.1 hypothetical protein DUNSADRAFT_4470 [Dunaliella salina]
MLPPEAGTPFEQSIAYLHTSASIPALVVIEAPLLWPRASSVQLAEAPEEAQQLLHAEAHEVCAALHAKGCRVAVVGVGNSEALSKLIQGGPLAALVTHIHILDQPEAHTDSADEQQLKHQQQKAWEQHLASLRHKTTVACSDTLAFCSCLDTIRAANRAGIRASVHVQGSKGLTADALRTGLCLYVEKAEDSRGF